MRNVYKILVDKPEGKRPHRKLGVDGRMMLEWILGTERGKMWTGFIWLKIGNSGGPL
jgi:hypothetical protein